MDGGYDFAIAVLRKGFDKWGDNPIIINNLAYAHLLRGETVPARLLLELIPKSASRRPYIAATEGLLLLSEGKIDDGDRSYRRAEGIASQSGNQDLALAIGKRDIWKWRRRTSGLVL